MLQIPSEAYTKKILDPLGHAQLVKNIEYYASLAGIAPSYIWTSAVDKLGDEEIEYLKHCRRYAKSGETAGVLYVGPDDVTEKFSIMVGALVRAFVDARLQTTAQIVSDLKHGDFPEATVLFIPNFFAAKDFGKFDTDRVAALCDLVVRRAARGEQTVLHIDSLVDAKTKLSGQFLSLLDQKFTDGEMSKQGMLDV